MSDHLDLAYVCDMIDGDGEELSAQSITPGIWVNSSHVYLLIAPSTIVRKRKRNRDDDSFYVSVFDCTPTSCRLMDVSFKKNSKRHSDGKKIEKTPIAKRVDKTDRFDFFRRLFHKAVLHSESKGPGKGKDSGVLWVYDGPNRCGMRSVLADICSRAYLKSIFVYAGCKRYKTIMGSCFGGGDGDGDGDDDDEISKALEVIYSSDEEEDDGSGSGTDTKPVVVAAKWIVCSTSVMHIVSWAFHRLGATTKKFRYEVFPIKSEYCTPDDIILLGLYTIPGAWKLAFPERTRAPYKIHTPEAVSEGVVSACARASC